MSWRLILEEFSNIEGSIYIATDAFSCLDQIDHLNNTNPNNIKVELTLESLSEIFAWNNEDVLHSTSFRTIMRFQQKDEFVIDIAKE